MSPSRVFFVGTPAEVEHHVRPLMDELSVTMIDPSKVVDASVAGDVAIFFSEHFDRFRQAVIDLRQKNVATIYMIDGILEWRNAWENAPDEIACPFTMRPVLSHKVACIGENQARVLAGWGNPGKPEIVGVPRFDAYDAVDANGLCDRGTNSPTDLFRILVMTAKTPAFTDDQWSVVKRSVSDCKGYFDQHRDRIEVTWRLTGGLDQHIGVTHSTDDLTGVQLRDQLRSVDAVISTPSTAVVESMLADKPTALLNYFECPCYLNPAWRIAHPSQIESVVSQLFRPTAAKMHFQRQQLHQTLYRETPAAGRMVQLVRAMQDSAARQLADGAKEINFAANLLPAPNSAVAHFNWQAMFSGVEAVSGVSVDGNTPINRDAERVQMLAQLAHSRRHIDHLGRRITQLETELGQAHEIFDQIHRHPIAGPIVRIRERLMGLLGKEKSGSSPEPSVPADAGAKPTLNDSQSHTEAPLLSTGERNCGERNCGELDNSEPDATSATITDGPNSPQR